MPEQIPIHIDGVINFLLSAKYEYQIKLLMGQSYDVCEDLECLPRDINTIPHDDPEFGQKLNQLKNQLYRQYLSDTTSKFN